MNLNLYIVGRDTFTQKSEFQLGRYELVLQMYPVDQRKKNYLSILALDPPGALAFFQRKSSKNTKEKSN